ncbi:hypothetical protein [Corynebacterium heidelbergense]|uniref:Uncharacterized protein n=1 Tax=Corynebacterium heidelbergense TaxID=2055947 RepID=A0A364VBX5_9CORY|nr:hypothetical protein [Corynebacterium heidelbergense]RAV34066.1 hypothetical protein CWC39_05130 [Corynebacterium heidelbergense]WCZ36379.1 hypothetical protein CHEID_04140 [Corynebacterium heidelbergense]
MLALSLALAVLGFVALLGALYFGSTVWAWVCVAVAAAGIALLIVEWRQSRRNPGRASGEGRPKAKPRPIRTTGPNRPAQEEDKIPTSSERLKAYSKRSRAQGSRRRWR